MMLWIAAEFESRVQLLWLVRTLLHLSIALCVIPALIAVYVVTLIWRQITRCLLRRYLLKAGSDISDSTSIWCAADTFKNPGIVTLMAILEGAPDVVAIKAAIFRDLINSKVETGNGLPKFPHLCQRLSLRLGHYVWTKDDNFQIDNHILVENGMWKGRLLTPGTLQGCVSEICTQFLPKNRPPWKLYILPLRQDDQTAIVFRAHHLLCENMAVKDLIEFLSIQSQSAIAEINSVTVSMFPGMLACRQLSTIVLRSFANRLQHLRQQADPAFEPAADRPALWTLVRFCVLTMQTVFVFLQKLYDSTDPNNSGRTALTRSVLMVCLLPFLLRKTALWNQLNCSFCLGLTLRRMLRWTLTFWFILPYVAAKSAIFCMAVTHQQLSDIKYFLTEHNTLIQHSMWEIYSLTCTLLQAPLVMFNTFFGHFDCHPFKRSSGIGRKVVAWSKPASMDLVRRISQASGATPTQVLTSCSVGAIRRYMLTLNLDVPDHIHVACPVFQLPFARTTERGKHAILPLRLPVGGQGADPATRLRGVKAHLSSVRRNPINYFLSVYFVNWALKLLPEFLVTCGINILTRKFAVTLVHIRLPSINGAGAKVWGHNMRSVAYWRPPQANATLTLSIVSTGSEAVLYAMSDQVAVPQPSMITCHFLRELHDLANSLRVRVSSTPSSPTRSHSEGEGDAVWTEHLSFGD